MQGVCSLCNNNPVDFIFIEFICNPLRHCAPVFRAHVFAHNSHDFFCAQICNFLKFWHHLYEILCSVICICAPCPIINLGRNCAAKRQYADSRQSLCGFWLKLFRNFLLVFFYDFNLRYFLLVNPDIVASCQFQNQMAFLENIRPWNKDSFKLFIFYFYYYIISVFWLHETMEV